MIETSSSSAHPGATHSVNVSGPEFNVPAEVKEAVIPATDDQKAVTGTSKPEEQKARDPASPEAATDEKPQDKPPSRLQQRIDELTRGRRDAERRAQDAVAEVQRLSARLQERSEKIDPNDFQATDEFRVEKAVRGGQIEAAYDEARRQAQEASDRRFEVFNAKVEAAREADPAIDQKLQAFNSVPVSNFGASFIADSAVAVELASHLGSNPAEAARIARLPDGQQGVELARLEAKLKTPPARKITQAPQPVPTLGGSRSPAVKDPTEMSASELSTLIYGKRN